MTKCGAKSKRTGQPCKNNAVAGSKRCRMHGGKSKSGEESGTYKNGLYCDHYRGKRRELYDMAARGKMTELEAAHEVHALAVARMDQALEAEALGGDDAPDHKTVTQVQSEYRLAVRGLLEATAVQDSEAEENTSIDVTVRVIDRPPAASSVADDE